ncbi:MAG: hypothetical protein A3C43_03590 [Candidatus Schekmanbacteria bacterium RIFCSPHIGHO2_02_FULL_38_11]|uniref:Uncharacterized protein n=1 Tax=Candidatus Schekmanbacteria bacterium RIFCSPLOWO2_12_FULL_38_15 TaxID=1817883 RepID=A0A1F7SK89_9BACT|nr:MAG: hypothetical protein A2043_08830 [Candidatus Schekmanbacteria bacterium GWA2_38_9]OGL49988.1 MAG: hypothetical protein A3C43_03590 [Candidatus Schekmanbacteria bacterium RIFCSPHIGHO2_02_FULL_38_11]OGL51228.1 MAG: hypothetical protein A3H37_10460 [Candidatus Schekmanbacteria bacterium RIFCSPLOWO2_02_FULL_38_14]OGL54179.1 MAG: hypothetical protein A3G31_05300 [Candidatus Schekmanbacteria bacterium RIFCSPLOWO2_12_FULL_38_15]
MKIRLFLLALIIVSVGFLFSSDKIAYSGNNETGSEINIDDVITKDFGENDGSNVDVFRVSDCDGDETTNDREGFSDVTATLTISNASRPNFSESTSHPVRIYKYKVSFQKIGSSVKKSKMPDIKGFLRNISFTVPAGDVDEPATKDLKVTIFSKAMKEAFADQYIKKFGENPSETGIIKYLDYNVKIKIFGREVTEEKNSAGASGETTIILTEVNNCVTSE